MRDRKFVLARMNKQINIYTRQNCFENPHNICVLLNNGLYADIQKPVSTYQKARDSYPPSIKNPEIEMVQSRASSASTFLLSSPTIDFLDSDRALTFPKARFPGWSFSVPGSGHPYAPLDAFFVLLKHAQRGGVVACERDDFPVNPALSYWYPLRRTFEPV